MKTPLTPSPSDQRVQKCQSFTFLTLNLGSCKVRFPTQIASRYTMGVIISLHVPRHRTPPHFPMRYRPFETRPTTSYSFCHLLFIHSSLVPCTLLRPYLPVPHEGLIVPRVSRPMTLLHPSCLVGLVFPELSVGSSSAKWDVCVILSHQDRHKLF